jgi:hypothetical protein
MGMIMLQLWYIFDCVDGEIARYRKSSTIAGLYFDRISHAIVHPYIFVCVTIGIFLKMQNILFFFFGFSASISVLLIYLSRAMRYSVHFEFGNMQLPSDYFSSLSKSSIKINSVNTKGKSNLQRFARIIFNYPGIMNLLTLAVILDFLAKNGIVFSFRLSFVSIFLIFYGLFLPYFWIKTIYITIKAPKTI